MSMRKALAKSMSDFTMLFLKDSFEQEATERRFEMQKELQDRQATVSLQKQQQLEQWRATDLADNLRARRTQMVTEGMEGIINSRAAEAGSAYEGMKVGSTILGPDGQEVPVTQEMVDAGKNAVSQAYSGDSRGRIMSQMLSDPKAHMEVGLRNGDLEYADKAKKISEGKFHNVAPGHTALDAEGNPVFKDETYDKMLIEREKIAGQNQRAALAALARGASGKKTAADDIKVGNKEMKEGFEAVKTVFPDLTHPYAVSEDDKKGDAPFASAVAMFAARAAAAKKVDTYTMVTDIAEEARQYDLLLRNSADTIVAEVFKKKDGLNERTKVLLKEVGVTATDPIEASKQFRDRYMTEKELGSYVGNPAGARKRFEQMVEGVIGKKAVFEGGKIKTEDLPPFEGDTDYSQPFIGYRTGIPQK